MNKRVSKRRRVLRKKKIDTILEKRTEADMRHTYMASHPLAQVRSENDEFDYKTQKIMISTQENELVPTREATKLLGIHRCSVYRWLSKGWLDGVRLPNGHIRVKMSSIKRALCGINQNTIQITKQTHIQEEHEICPGHQRFIDEWLKEFVGKGVDQ